MAEMHTEHNMTWTAESLRIDPATETERIIAATQRAVRQVMRKRGAVIGVSGGVDSSTVLGLCAKALGPGQVVALLLPEKDSDPDSLRLGRRAAVTFGVETIVEDLTAALEGIGCYRRRDEAIRRVFPDYDAASGYKAKIVLPQLESGGLNLFSLCVIAPDGREQTKRLALGDYLQIVAASNFKQRARMSMLYYHAEARNFAVIGTPNKNEHEQGFFVKHGDSGADFRPIVHLLKTQVYQIAEHIGVPREIIDRPPTTDTYSAFSTQEEFFFRLPFATMDVLWHAQESGVETQAVARAMGIDKAQVQRAFDDFDRKRQTTEYLRAPALSVPEVERMAGTADPAATEKI